MNRRFVLATALLIPALAYVSCKDGNAPTADEPLTPSLRQAPTQAARPDWRTFKAPPMRDVPTMIVGSAPHNPRSQVGQPLQCFDGVSDGPQDGITYGGTCQRMNPTRDGAELKTNGGDADGEYAGVIGAQGVRGKLIGNVIELSFSFAGGPNVGGSPRWSIPISEDGDNIYEPPDFPVPDPTEVNEAHAFIAADRCNDQQNRGDNLVGFLDGNDDATCFIDHKGIAYPNWAAFVSAHPTWRVALQHVGGGPAFTFVIADSPTHTLIWNLRSQ